MTFPAFSRGILAAAIVLSVTGCASIVSESSYPVSVTSSPNGARYEIANEDGQIVHSGVTPGLVTLDAGAGYFDGETYLVTYRKDGHEEQKTTLESKVDGWYWGNLAFGGIIGMLIVDPATGAMYKLPKHANATLPAKPVPVPMATPQVSDSSAKSKDQLLNELSQMPGISYEEYQRRYELITRQP